MAGPPGGLFLPGAGPAPPCVLPSDPSVHPCLDPAVTQHGPARAPNTGGERQPSGFCPSPVTILEGPGPGPPLSASGVSSSVGVGVPLPCPSRPCPGLGHGPRAACLLPALPRAGSAAPASHVGSRRRGLSSGSGVAPHSLCPCSVQTPLTAAGAVHGAALQPGSCLHPPPPCRGPGTRWSLWLSPVPTALLPSFQAALED